MKVEEILFEEVSEKNKQTLEQLRENLKSDEWAFCLGAGISISAGLPNWYGLLAKLTAQILEVEANKEFWAEGKKENKNNIAYYKGVGQVYETLPSGEQGKKFWEKKGKALNGDYSYVFSNINVLEAAEYIKNFVEESVANTRDESLMKSESMKNRIDWYMNQLIRETCRTDTKVGDIKESTLGAVARLMNSKLQIHNAITYNYDNLLETYLREVCKCNTVNSIVKEDELRDFGNKDERNVYHVHGRIPVIDYPGEEMSDNVILTESDYYREEQVNYSWTNIIQSYVIARCNLIFVGFSGTDYNFRRIIKYVKQDKMKPHSRYIFFAVDDIVKAVFQKELEGLTEGEKDTRLRECIKAMNAKESGYVYERLLINHLIHAQSLYWENHGLTVIWTSLQELPEQLDNLY